MMIQSRTGSGKTGAYLLPILEMVNPLQNTTQALILAPTRELALQIATEAELLGRNTGVRSVAVYGGVGYRAQLDAFKAGGTDRYRHAWSNSRPPTAPFAVPERSEDSSSLMRLTTCFQWVFTLICVE